MEGEYKALVLRSCFVGTKAMLYILAAHPDREACTEKYLEAI